MFECSARFFEAMNERQIITLNWTKDSFAFSDQESIRSVTLKPNVLNRHDKSLLQTQYKIMLIIM